MADVPFDAQDRAARICDSREWTLGKKIGEGGSAAVFSVTTSDGEAALKVFFPKFINGREGAITRNRLDIVKQSLIPHDCDSLVKIHAIDDFEDAPFMLMELVDGQMLTDVLRLVPADAIEAIVRQIAQAVKYLEDRKLTHRDVKSDNIIVDAAFRKATLVDVGVVRVVDDTVGSGTDDDGQLPFVATARYSSPEYMFRLMAPGPELWRALNFYQLGGLIHDLLAGEPLFEDVVQQASSNRYLIAYAVATKVPAMVTRPDVPDYLAVLAHRCLLKDPAARLASITWEDFLERDPQRENEALLGLRGDQPGIKTGGVVDISGLARALELSLDEKLMGKGISCVHATEVKTRNTSMVSLRWSPLVQQRGQSKEIEVSFEIVGATDSICIVASARAHEDEAVTVSLAPAVVANGEAEAAVGTLAYELFLDVSAQLVKRLNEGAT